MRPPIEIERPPIEIERPPHRDLGVPPSRFERWYMGGKSYWFWPETTLKFSISARKLPSDFGEDPFFWRSPNFH